MLSLAPSTTACDLDRSAIDIHEREDRCEENGNQNANHDTYCDVGVLNRSTWGDDATIMLMLESPLLNIVQTS